MVRGWTIAAALALLLVPTGAWAQGPFMEIEIEPSAPYVQQQVTVTARLYRRSSLESGYFVETEALDTLFLPLDEEPPEEVILDGERHQVLSKRYLAFPLASGPWSLPAVAYSGRTVHTAAPPRTVAVRPPADDRRPWLPARKFGIAEDWQGLEPPLAVGEQAIRILTVTAMGLTGAQLPPLPVPEVAGLRIYRESAQSEDRVIDGMVHGRRIERHVVVAMGGGDFTLPPIILPWWNLEENRPETARLAERTVSVSGPAIAPPPLRESAQATPGPIVAADEETKPPAPPWPKLATWAGGVAGVAVALFGVIALVRAAEPAMGRALRRRRARIAVARACRADDPAAAARCLMAWADHVWPDDPPRTVRALAERLDCAALDDLDRVLWGRTRAPWDGAAAWGAVAAKMAAVGRSGAEKRPPIPALNPTAMQHSNTK